MPKHQPLRTCIACRKKDARSDLLRFVLQGGEVLFDAVSNRDGRGAWLHAGCLNADLSPQFSRAFRKSVNAGRLVQQVYTESKAESMQTQK